MEKAKQRQSGIELLKIIAMILIVTGHIIQTLGSAEIVYYPTDYIFHYENASTNIQSLILSWMTIFGAQGNLIFFTCSAWFLLESKAVNVKKIMTMLADVWIINVVILIILKIGGWFDISGKDIIKSIFPNTFANNWYITCYILFYLIHPMLNRIIKSCSQKELLTTNLVALTLYYDFGYIKGSLFFVSNLILFVVIYFLIAYMKQYLPVFCKSRKWNLVILAVGVAGTPIMILLTNILGLHISLFQDKLTHWGSNSSPFLLLTAIALFNLFRKNNFINPTINKMSSFSLLVYIIHENLLLREYVRPLAWIYIHNTFGYSYVLLWVLILAALIFAGALALSFLYSISIQRIVHKVSNSMYTRLITVYEKILPILLKIQ